MTNQFIFRLIAISSLCLLTLMTVAAQTKRRNQSPAPPPVPTATVAPDLPEDTPVQSPNQGKKNARPGSESQTTENRDQKTKNSTPVYFYEFTQPEYLNSHIVIEHDENGKGKITLRKKDLDEDFNDPIQLSPATLEKIKSLWAALNFLDSTENYQSTVRDYPHLGAMRLKMTRDGRTRETEFNWSENLDAKALADEYKKLSYQLVWMFDMSVARESMPLDAPRVMRQLDAYLKRNEISDPPSLIPYLRELTDDERIPLIARNAAARMIAEIEKKAAKK